MPTSNPFTIRRAVPGEVAPRPWALSRWQEAVSVLDDENEADLVSAIEEHFGLEIDDEELTGDVFASVGTLVEFVDSKRG